MKNRKMIKKNVFVVLAALLAFVLLISACGNAASSPEELLVGSWKLSNYEESVSLIPWNGTILDDWFNSAKLGFFPDRIVFYRDGTFSAVSITGLTAENSKSVRTKNIGGTWRLIHDGASLELTFEGDYGRKESVSLDISISKNSISVIGIDGKFAFVYDKAS